MDANISLRIKYEQTCPDCGASDFVEDHSSGDLICRSCGVVVEARLIDERSEWRTFSDSDKSGADMNRVGGPVNALLSDGGLSTVIAGGKGVDRGLAANLARLQARTSGGADRALLAAFREVGAVCTAMKLPDVVRHQANEYYRDAQARSRAVRARPQSAVVAAVVFLACRQTGYPRTFKEICAFVPAASKRDIGRTYKLVVADLQLRESGALRPDVGAHIHPEHFLRRFMSSLGFANADMVTASALANALLPQEGPGAGEHRPWHGRSPATYAGTCMYIVARLPRASRKPSLEDLCAVCGVAETTIRGLYAVLHPHLAEIVAAAGGFASAEEIATLPPPPASAQAAAAVAAHAARQAVAQADAAADEAAAQAAAQAAEAPEPKAEPAP
jgi:transcription initiation factor TFIIB